jgi:hypothetical protein
VKRRNPVRAEPIALLVAHKTGKHIGCDTSTRLSMMPFRA